MKTEVKGIVLWFAELDLPTRRMCVRVVKRGLVKGVLPAILVAIAGGRPAFAVDAAAHLTTADPERTAVERHRPKRANFNQERVSPGARHVADWIVDSGGICQ